MLYNQPPSTACHDITKEFVEASESDSTEPITFRPSVDSVG